MPLKLEVPFHTHKKSLIVYCVKNYHHLFIFDVKQAPAQDTTHLVCLNSDYLSPVLLSLTYHIQSQFSLIVCVLSRESSPLPSITTICN